jgi:hypothetical protein
MVKMAVGLVLILSAGWLLATSYSLSYDRGPLQMVSLFEGVLGLFYLGWGTMDHERERKRERDGVRRGFPVLPPQQKE